MLPAYAVRTGQAGNMPALRAPREMSWLGGTGSMCRRTGRWRVLWPRRGRAVYQRKFTVPGAWRGKRIKFRAEGIYSKAEVWVNGQRMGSHDGGATPVEWDISAAAKPGAENLLTILVTDHSDADDLSAMSFYAHFNLGGIWRPLEVFCVEPAHIARLAVETRFDAACRDAELELNLDVANEQSRELRDAQLSVQPV